MNLSLAVLSQFKVVASKGRGGRVIKAIQRLAECFLFFLFQLSIFIVRPLWAQESHQIIRHCFFYSAIKFISGFLCVCSMFEFSFKRELIFLFLFYFIYKTHLTVLYSWLAKQKHTLHVVNILMHFLNILSVNLEALINSLIGEVSENMPICNAD